MQQRISYEEQTTILDLFSQGKTLKQIASYIGCHHSSVANHLKKCGYKSRPKNYRSKT